MRFGSNISSSLALYLQLC